jgi:hypothetical protein
MPAAEARLGSIAARDRTADQEREGPSGHGEGLPSARRSIPNERRQASRQGGHKRRSDFARRAGRLGAHQARPTQGSKGRAREEQREGRALARATGCGLLLAYLAGPRAGARFSRDCSRRKGAAKVVEPKFLDHLARDERGHRRRWPSPTRSDWVTGAGAFGVHHEPPPHLTVPIASTVRVTSAAIDAHRVRVVVDERRMTLEMDANTHFWANDAAPAGKSTNAPVTSANACSRPG